MPVKGSTSTGFLGYTSCHTEQGIQSKAGFPSCLSPELLNGPTSNCRRNLSKQAAAAVGWWNRNERPENSSIVLLAGRDEDCHFCHWASLSLCPCIVYDTINSIIPFLGTIFGNKFTKQLVFFISFKVKDRFMCCTMWELIVTHKQPHLDIYSIIVFLANIRSRYKKGFQNETVLPLPSVHVLSTTVKTLVGSSVETFYREIQKQPHLWVT